MSNYDRLVQMFLDYDNFFDEKYDDDRYVRNWKFGHYNPENYSICLYAAHNKPEVLQQIRTAIDKITTNYKFIVLDPQNPEFTNINILDIDL